MREDCNARRHVDAVSAPAPDWHAWLEANVPHYLLFARSQTRGEADAHDVLQEVLVEVWRRRSGRLPDDALVFQTIRRRAVDLGRRLGRRERREQAAPAWWEAADQALDRDAELADAMKQLSTPLRDVVLLKIWGELTFRQIAEALEVPLATAASRYRYALEQLRKALPEVHP